LDNQIFLLDENTSNRIAAGEVVERPASVVKELTENSIDADARHIVVHLDDGGRKRIMVADDGFGMGREDAVLSLQRHATSKIRSADDLFSIRTLGFRGEALPSIASVSHFTLVTVPSDNVVGTRIVVHGGDIESVEDIGGPQGTSITVEDIFYNTPARLKFLKTTSTELTRSVEIVSCLAIINPHIAFKLIHNNQEVISSPGNNDPIAAISAIWGREIARKAIPIEYDANSIRIHGYLCPPEMNRPGRSHELFFVKFLRDAEMHHAVSQAIKQSLLKFGMIPEMRLSSNTDGMPSSPPFRANPSFHGGMDLQTSIPQNVSGESIQSAIDAFTPITSAMGGVSTNNAGEVEVGSLEPPNGNVFASMADESLERKPFKEKLKGFKVLGQAINTYIIALTEQGIAIIDQHVAHERVLYERLTVLRAKQGVPVQRLAIPITLSLGAAEATLLKQRLGDFAENGWDIEPFGKDSFLVRSVPSYASRGATEALLRDMVDELAHLSVARRLLVQKEHVTITNACKLAVKAGDPLNMEEMNGLLQQLAETENPYLCPHGRPIVVILPFDSINRQFKR
jgi:DNA mismatch repair protein MutL